MYIGMSTIFIYPILLGISWVSWVLGVISFVSLEYSESLSFQILPLIYSLLAFRDF